MCFRIVEHWEYMLTEQHLGHYYKPCESAFFRLPLSPIARYPSLLSTSPFLVTGISHVAICYSTLSTPLILRTIKPCELRNFLHKQISPCELRLTWLACASSIRCLSHMTESVFAFLIVSGIWTYCLLLNRELLYQMSYNNLLRCADSVAAYSFGIHNTTHHVPFLLRSNQTSFTINVGSRLSRTSINHSNCIQALRCNPSDKYATLSHTN